MSVSLPRYRSTGKLRKSFRKRIISSPRLIPTLIIVTIVVFACLHIWQRVYVLGLVQEISVVEKERENLTDLLKKTNSDAAELSRLSRMEPIAIEKLGLGRTSAENLFTLEVKKQEITLSGIDNVKNSLKKLADNLPVINETKADTIHIFENDKH
jgi:cell division protein FtsL